MTRATSGLAALLAAMTIVPASPALAEPALRLGFNDLNTIQHLPSERPLELQHLRATRASTVRLMWEWDSIERVKPPNAAMARDPAWPGYDWSALDAALRDVAAAGVTPVITIYRTPRWWEGPGRPKISTKAREGTWKPDPAAFGRFMYAAALRYSGGFPDPEPPSRPLPLVKFWEAWNEPNLAGFLTPQWVKTGSRYRAASPGLYRPMLAAAYDEIKAANPGAVVLSGGTAPYAEPKPGGTRMAPARFIRDLFCVSAKGQARNCRSHPAKFDVLSHHPYPIGSPTRRALNEDDVTIPDFGKLKRPLAIALRAGNVAPRAPKQIWATEMSWDTRPPDPRGISPQRQALYAAGSMYMLYKQGVDALIWWNLRDDARDRGYQFTLQSGVYFRGTSVATSTPKPSAAVFRFPFVARAAGRSSAAVWGLAPAPGPVTIQIRRGTAWRDLETTSAGRSNVFGTRLRARRGELLRAVQSGEPSPAYPVGKL